jgi:hypothetical protein
MPDAPCTSFTLGRREFLFRILQEKSLAEYFFTAMVGDWFPFH